MFIPKAIGHRLAEVRKERYLTQRALAALSSIDYRRLAALERGRRVPRKEELAWIGRALSISLGDLVRGTDWSETPAPGPWARAAREVYLAFRKKRERPGLRRRALGYRLFVASQEFPAIFLALLEIVKARPDFEELKRFAVPVQSDSDSEGLMVMHLLAGPSTPVRFSPYSLGFRNPPVVDPTTGAGIGDCRVPGFHIRLGAMECIFLPQVTVQAGGRPTLDFLCIVKLNGVTVYLDVEVDGAGHRARRDEKRKSQLKLPTVRVLEEDLESPAFLRILEGKIREVLPVGAKAAA